jgi:sporulation protein YlmC with PRC-barrel domain
MATTMTGSITTTTTMTDSALIASNRVEGTEVFDTTGKRVGAIKHLVIDKASGRVVYTVASFGGFLGMGAEEFTIPWNALRYDTRLGGYVTTITPDQLRDSPRFARGADPDEVDFWSDRAREQSLYDHYGSPYYWIE